MLTLLSTTELLNALLIIMLAIEADADSNTDIVLHTLACILIVRINLLTRASRMVCLALDDETTTTCRNKLFKHIVKLAGHLLEGSLNGLVLALIKDRDEIIDRLLRCVQLGTTGGQRLTLFGETVVLLKCLLVDMRILL